MGDSGLKHFEGNLEQLKKYTDNIERGDLPLAELMSQFKAGLKIAQQCQQTLQQTELEIKQLIESSSLTPYDTSKKDPNNE